MPKNALYAQSGGVTSVINATACAVIETAKNQSQYINKVYACKNGIVGALQENLYDTSVEDAAEIAALRHTAGGVFGSCRYRLNDHTKQLSMFKRLHQVFKAHDIGYFFYNGGGDSQDTAHKVANFCSERGLQVRCIGIPKTIDNDLALTDNCPGFGSVAKYVAVSVLEASLDVASMCFNSTQVFIMEVMGRHSGWIAAASALIKNDENSPPHLILFPERPLEMHHLYKRVGKCVRDNGYCVIVVSEGVKSGVGSLLHGSKSQVDAFGHVQLGGVAVRLAETIKRELGYKCHYAIADYLQRSARHIASQTDLEQAYAVGEAAVESAVAGNESMMVTIERRSDIPYKWSTGLVPLAEVANIEKYMPDEFISSDGYGITPAARNYLLPLIQGEAEIPYENGLPRVARLKKQLLERKLPDFDINNNKE